MSGEPAAPQDALVVVNRFTPRAGAIDRFLEVHCAGLRGMQGRVAGLVGSRVYRAEHGGEVVMLSVFEDAAAFDRFLSSELFATHRARLQPWLEKTEPGKYRMVYDYGRC